MWRLRRLHARMSKTVIVRLVMSVLSAAAGYPCGDEYCQFAQEMSTDLQSYRQLGRATRCPIMEKRKAQKASLSGLCMLCFSRSDHGYVQLHTFAFSIIWDEDVYILGPRRTIAFHYPLLDLQTRHFCKALSCPQILFQ